MAKQSTARAGWQTDPEDDTWWRWWDGSNWHEAYWPRSLKPQSYLPELPRLNLSNTNDYYSFDVVGEHARSEEIEAVLGRAPRLNEEIEWFGDAELIPEPDNPFDESGMAVAVRVNGHCVGYLPRGDSTGYADLVHESVRRGAVPVVAVRIWAVTRRNREENLVLAAAVRLAMPNADRALPVNSAPAEEHFVLPRGRAVQVSGEEEHLEVLQSYVDGDAEKAIVVTLHPFEKVTPRVTQTLVEVRVDGERIGQLSPVSSKSVLPLIRECERRDRVAAAWAVLKGSRFAAEVVLRLAKPEDVDSSWPTERDVIPALDQRSMKVLPAAFRQKVPITNPPEPRAFGKGAWIAIVIGLLLIASVPYVGILLLVGAVVGLVFWTRSRRKQAPRQALAART